MKYQIKIRFLIIKNPKPLAKAKGFLMSENRKAERKNLSA